MCIVISAAKKTRAPERFEMWWWGPGIAAEAVKVYTGRSETGVCYWMRW